MKRMRKCLSMIIIFCLILGLATKVSASELGSILVLKSNKNAIVVREITSEGITIATNDKNTNLLKIEKFDKSGKILVSSQILNLKTIVNENKDIERFFDDRHLERHTISGYGYDVWYGYVNRWRISKPQHNTSINLVENKENKDNIYDFSQKVHDVGQAEGRIIGVIGATLALVAITAYFSGGLAAALAVAGAGATITLAFIDLGECCSRAQLSFNRIAYS